MKTHRRTAGARSTLASPLLRKGGTHGKPSKALRARDKDALRRETRRGWRDQSEPTGGSLRSRHLRLSPASGMLSLPLGARVLSPALPRSRQMACPIDVAVA